MKKTLAIILAILMIVTTIPMAFAATEASGIPTGTASYYDGVTQYFKYNNYLYKIVWGNYKFHSTDGTTSVKLVTSGNYLACFPNGYSSNDYLNKKISGLKSTRCTVNDLPKTIDASLNCFNEMSSRHVDPNKPIAVITCVGVKAPTWTWSDDKTSATAVFVSEDGKAQVTIGATVTSVEVPADCLNQGKITYTATATCNGQNYTDTYTVYGDVKPHDWSNLDGVCAYGCGTVCRHENRTDGVCDVCGYECLHEETYETVTKLEHFSVQNSDGTWTKATISVVCRECESVIEYKEADRADYTEFDKAMARVTELLESGDLTEDKYNHYNSVIGSFKTDSYQGSPFQEAADSYADSLEYIVNEIEAGLADGTMKKADWTYMTALLEEVNTLIDNDANNIVPKVIGYYYSPRGFYNGSVNNPNYSQAAYNEAIANYDLENMLETLIAGLKDGTMLKADYTEIDEAIAELNEKLVDVNITDEAKAGLDEIKAELEKLRRNTYASKADLAVLEKALEDYETELDAGIADGTAVKVDGMAIVNKMQTAWTLKIENDGLKGILLDYIFNGKITEEATEKQGEIKAFADSLEGSVTDNADNIKQLEEMVNEFLASFENCIYDRHNFGEYKVIEDAKCGENAVEEAACWFCYKKVTREVENSALTHSFTKYEVTEEAKCGVEGKEVAACDNGCGEIEVRATEALKHIPLDAVKENEVDPECEKEGSYDLVVYCDICGGEISRETFAVDALEHLFLDYIYNEDATCTENGTKTAVCDNGCGETDTVTAEDTMLNHADEDGDNICDNCETVINDVCPDCGEAIHENKLGEYICILKTIIKAVVDIIALLKTITSVFA